jgi:hypothetical protein
MRIVAAVGVLANSVKGRVVIQKAIHIVAKQDLFF